MKAPTRREFINQGSTLNPKDYTAQHQQHRLAPAMAVELAEFQQKAPWKDHMELWGLGV